MPTPIERLAESDLLPRLRSRDQAAFAELLRRLGPPLLAAARRILGSTAEAEDAFQNAMVAAFRSIDSFGERSTLSTWLNRIVVNEALMRCRSARRRTECSIEDLLPDFLEGGHHRHSPHAWSVGPAELAQRNELREHVRDQIDRLPESYREAVLLRDIEGLSTTEAAEMLEVTPNTVKIRLHRGRQALRTLLNAHMTGDAS